MAGNKHWRPQEDEYLKRTYGIIPLSQITQHLNRSAYAVRWRASSLGLVQKEEHRKWTVKDSTFLAGHHSEYTYEELSRILNRSVSSIAHKIANIKAKVATTDPAHNRRGKAGQYLHQIERLEIGGSISFPAADYQTVINATRLYSERHFITQKDGTRGVRTLWRIAPPARADKWSPEYDELVLKHFNIEGEGPEWLAMVLQRSIGAIKTRASVLSATKKRKNFTPEEYQFIIDNMNRLKAAEIARTLKCTVHAVHAHIRNYKKGKRPKLMIVSPALDIQRITSLVTWLTERKEYLNISGIVRAAGMTAQQSLFMSLSGKKHSRNALPINNMRDVLALEKVLADIGYQYQPPNS